MEQKQVHVFEQKQELINEQEYAELVKKFESAEILEFLSFNFSIEELKRAQVVHPTVLDPIILLDGKPVGMWI